MERRTLSLAEGRRLLAHTSSAPRDHAIFALALGAGLRLAEISALNLSDVHDGDRLSWRIRLPEAKRQADYSADVLLHANTVRRIRSYVRAEVKRRGTGPVFLSRRGPRAGGRLGHRGIQAMWKRVQRQLGWVDGRGVPLYTFHDLRRTSITQSLHRSGGNLELARRFARHASSRTTSKYVYLSPEELREAAPIY